MEEREKWEKEKNEIQVKRNEEEFQRAMATVDNAILDLLPKTKEAKQTVDLLNRVTISFDVVLEKGLDQIPRVKVSVENTSPKLSILIDPQVTITCAAHVLTLTHHRNSCPSSRFSRMK